MFSCDMLAYLDYLLIPISEELGSTEASRDKVLLIAKRRVERGRKMEVVFILSASNLFKMLPFAIDAVELNFCFGNKPTCSNVKCMK